MNKGLETFASGADRSLFQFRLIRMLQYYFHQTQEFVSTMSGNRHAFVTMEQLKADTEGSIRRVYSRLDMEMSSEFVDHLQSRDSFAKKYKSRHRYSLAQFGLDTDTLYGSFHPVFERYGYPRPETGAPDSNKSLFADF